MDFNLHFHNPEEEEGLDSNEESGGVNQQHSGEKSNKCNQCDYIYENNLGAEVHLLVALNQLLYHLLHRELVQSRKE